jgi:hypothetical protein
MVSLTCQAPICGYSSFYAGHQHPFHLLSEFQDFISKLGHVSPDELLQLADSCFFS